MADDGLDDITRKPSIGRGDDDPFQRAERGAGARRLTGASQTPYSGELHVTAGGSAGSGAPPSVHTTIAGAAPRPGLETTERAPSSTPGSALLNPLPVPIGRAPGAAREGSGSVGGGYRRPPSAGPGLDPRRRSREATASGASPPPTSFIPGSSPTRTAFDDSDSSEDLDSDLARRSAIMQPRSAIAASAAAAATVAGSTAGAATASVSVPSSSPVPPLVGVLSSQPPPALPLIPAVSRTGSGQTPSSRQPSSLGPLTVAPLALAAAPPHVMQQAVVGWSQLQTADLPGPLEAGWPHLQTTAPPPPQMAVIAAAGWSQPGSSGLLDPSSRYSPPVDPSEAVALMFPPHLPPQQSIPQPLSHQATLEQHQQLHQQPRQELGGSPSLGQDRQQHRPGQQPPEQHVRGQQQPQLQQEQHDQQQQLRDQYLWQWSQAQPAPSSAAPATATFTATSGSSMATPSAAPATSAAALAGAVPAATDLPAPPGGFRRPSGEFPALAPVPAPTGSAQVVPDVSTTGILLGTATAAASYAGAGSGSTPVQPRLMEQLLLEQPRELASSQALKAPVAQSPQDSLPGGVQQAASGDGGGGDGGGGIGGGGGERGSVRSAKPLQLPTYEQVAENLRENREALALFEPEHDEGDRSDDDEDDDEPPLPWCLRPAVLWAAGMMGCGLVLLVVGVILHNVFESSSDAFRWFYFFAAIPLLYYGLSYAVKHAFLLLEWWFFRESLFYLVSVQQKALWLLFCLALLPWYRTVFRWAWCSPTPSFPKRCQQAAYVQVTNAMWNVLLCLMLFCLANLLKAVLAKVLTTHFYRTAHFKKLKKALEKEYALQVLSRPRRVLVAARLPQQPHPHAPGEGPLSGGTWLALGSFLHPGTARRGGGGGGWGGGGWGGGLSGRRAPGGTAAASAVATTAAAAAEPTGTKGTTADADVGAGAAAAVVGTFAVAAGEERVGLLSAGEAGGAGTGGSTAGDTTAAAVVATASAVPPFGPAAPGEGDSGHGAPVPQCPRGEPAGNSDDPAAVDSSPADPSPPAPAATAPAPAALPYVSCSPSSSPSPSDGGTGGTAGGGAGGGGDGYPGTSPAAVPGAGAAAAVAAADGGNAGGATAAFTAVTATAHGAAPGGRGTEAAAALAEAPTLAAGVPPHQAAQTPPYQPSNQPPYPSPQQPQPQPQPPPSKSIGTQGAEAPREVAAGAARPNMPAALAPAVANGSSGGGEEEEDTGLRGGKAPGSPQSGAAPGPAGRLRGMLAEVAQGLGELGHRLMRRQDSRGSAGSRGSGGSKGSARKGQRGGSLAAGDPAAAGRLKKGPPAEVDVSEAMVQAVPPGNTLTANKGLHMLTDDELEKVRTAIVIKTQSALIKKYRDKSDEDMVREHGRVRRFAKALFFNVLPPEADRDYLLPEDFMLFFEAAEGAEPTTAAVTSTPHAEAPASVAALTGGVGTPYGDRASRAVSLAPSRRETGRRGVGGDGLAAAAAMALPSPGPQNASGGAGGGAGGGGGGTGAPVATPSPASGRGRGGGGAVSFAEGRPRAASVGVGLKKSPTMHAADRVRAVRQRSRQRAAEEAAKKAFAVFDEDNNGEVTLPEVRQAVLNIYKERRNMARSLKDTETIVQSLEFGIGGVIHFVFAAVYLLIWGVDLLTGFSTFSATVLALTFVFGNSVKNMYESMLFLFVIHPYDVGDCVVVGTEMYRVKKISLLYTDMVKSNGERVYMPNTSLIANPSIVNWTRSKTKSESCRLVCDIGVAWEVREGMQAALRAYAAEHPGEFEGEPSCNFRELVDPLKVVLVCSWTYNFAPDEFSRLGPARNGMLFIVQQKAREHRLQNTTLTEAVRGG